MIELITSFPYFSTAYVVLFTWNKYISIRVGVTGVRKCIINLKYVLKRLFNILGLPYENIKITTSKKTLKYFNQWWNNVYGLVKNDINKIINKWFSENRKSYKRENPFVWHK